MENFLFYALSLAMVFCALRAMTSPYIFRAALYLAATLSLTAVQYILLHAEFVAIVQPLVYVGAVIILIIFAVMLTAQLGEGNIGQSNGLALPAALLSAIVGYSLYKLQGGYDWSKVAPAAGSPDQGWSNIQAIGHALIDNYILPFEIIGLLLFTALVGAVLIARKDGAQ